MWSGEKDNFISSQKLAQACVKTASQRTRGPGRTTAQDRRKRPDSFACERPRDQYSSLSAGQGWAAEPTRGRATERSTQHSRRETPSRPALPGQRLGPRTVGPAQPETSRGLGGQDKYFRSGNTSLLVWQIPRTKLVFYLQPLSLLPTRTLLSEAGARCVSQGSGQSRRDRGAARSRSLQHRTRRQGAAPALTTAEVDARSPVPELAELTVVAQPLWETWGARSDTRTPRRACSRRKRAALHRGPPVTSRQAGGRGRARLSKRRQSSASGKKGQRTHATLDAGR